MANEEKTWSRGHFCRLPFAVNAMLNLSIYSCNTSTGLWNQGGAALKKEHSQFLLISFERDVWNACVFCGGWLSPADCFTRDQVATFQTEDCFQVHFSARAWYCSNRPMRRSRRHEIRFLRNLFGTREIMLARSSKHCRFRSRTCWKNGTFSVHSCAMTTLYWYIQVWKKCIRMWITSRATADSLRRAGGTIVELYNFQAC